MKQLFTLLLTLASVACGPADKPSSAPGTASATANTLRIGNGAEPQTLDPHRAEGVPESNILRNLFEGLVGEAPDGGLVPGVAESWILSDDGLVYTFQLRKNARWSNGDPVTARDFEYGLRRSVDPATLSRYSSILFPIVNAEAVVNGDLPPSDLGVRAIDEYTFEIRLNAPTAYLPGMLTHSSTYPVHQPSVAAGGERFARPGKLVSNGAYQLSEWVVQSHVRLDRNPEYWDAANTQIDTVYFYAIENPDAELKRYRADELDITDGLPYNQLTWVRENLGDELVIAPWFGSYYFGFNLSRPPFENAKALRTALAMAIDRDILTTKVTGAGEIAAYGWVPPADGYTGQQPDWAGWPQQERNARAQELYAEAGYSEGRPLQVEVLYNTNENHKRISVAIASMWKQVLGVETSLVNQEWKVFLETRNRKEDTEVFRAGWIGDYNDPYSFAQLMHSKNAQNDSAYYSDEYDELLDLAAVELDPRVRMQLMEAAEQQLLEDLPIIPIYFYVSKHLVKPRVHGYTPNIMDHHHVKHLSLSGI
mgnify:CR=1 FL=1